MFDLSQGQDLKCVLKNRKRRNAMDEKPTQKPNVSSVLTLKDLAQYQDRSVVSREIIQKLTGTMTVFAFDKGEGLSEHTAPFDAAVYILEGEAEIRIDGKPYSVKEGEMIIMPAHKPHALRAVTRYKMLLVLIR
jgi:quercetin dioxygenase-like cupin family protein